MLHDGYMNRFFLLPLFTAIALPPLVSADLQFERPHFQQQGFNYELKCGLKKLDCNLAIHNNYIKINQKKIQKKQIKKIQKKLLCHSDFGLSKCQPENIKNIAMKKILIIYNQKELLKANLLFVEDIVLANNITTYLEKWLGWSDSETNKLFEENKK
tara:strand:+ start:2354 stop:2824 length:471 start_codon:yes stop_codon:yes gene_type:complete